MKKKKKRQTNLNLARGTLRFIMCISLYRLFAVSSAVYSFTQQQTKGYEWAYGIIFYHVKEKHFFFFHSLFVVLSIILSYFFSSLFHSMMLVALFVLVFIVTIWKQRVKAHANIPARLWFIYKIKSLLSCFYFFFHSFFFSFIHVRFHVGNLSFDSFSLDILLSRDMFRDQILVSLCTLFHLPLLVLSFVSINDLIYTLRESVIDLIEFRCQNQIRSLTNSITNAPCCPRKSWTDRDGLLRIIHVQVLGIRRSSPNDKLNETWHVYNFSFYEAKKRTKKKRITTPSSVWNVISLFFVFHYILHDCSCITQAIIFFSRSFDTSISLFSIQSMLQIVAHFRRVVFIFFPRCY